MVEKQKLLTEQDMRVYFEKYQNGNLDARDILICQNTGLIYLVIKNKFRSYFDKESLVFAGKVGLIHAVDHFDLKKEIEFSTFATKCIYHEMLKIVNEEKYQQPLSLNQLQDNSTDEGKKSSLEDTLKDETINAEKEIEKKELYNYLYRALEKLPERTRKMIICYYNLNHQKSYTLGDLEKIYGISDTRILQILEKGYRQLKACLEFEYLSSHQENKDSSLVNYLAPKDQKMMMLYLDGYSKTSIASLLSLSVNEVSRRMKEIKQQLIYLGKEEEMKTLLKKRIPKQVVRK